MATLEDRFLGHLAATIRSQARRLDATARARPYGRGRHHLTQAAQRCRDAADELDALANLDEPASPATEAACPTS